MEEKIMVSICCIAYNQEKYIRETLDGFLMQRTNFKYEIIIHDDASTDNTSNIIKEYEKKYPEIIKPIYQKENQYRKGISTSIITYNQAKGKYIALCEGDDCWINENKLQMQVDYMEKHLDCTLLFHNAKIMDMMNEKEEIFVPYTKEAKKYMKKNGNYDVGELELLGFIPTASYMFRTENLSKLPYWFKECYVKDWPLKLIMTSFGYAHYIDKVMSVYRSNTNGSVTKSNIKKENQDLNEKLKMLNKKENFIKQIDEFTKYKYHEVFNIRLLQYETERLFHTGKGKELIKKRYIQYILPESKMKYLLEIYFPKSIARLKKIKHGIINKK